MNEMTSSEFRRRYATLTQPTTVTVLGRPIGVWQPHLYTLRAGDGTALTKPITLARVEASRRSVLRAYDSSKETFNSRPFTPAPKKGK